MTGTRPAADAADPAARDARSGLVAAGVVVLLVLVGLAGRAAVERLGAPPVSVADARLDGEVWTMPTAQVRGFLAARGVEATVTDDGSGAPSVVARVSWAPHPTSSDVRYVLVLGDRTGGAGAVGYVLGAPADDSGTSSGSPYAPLMQSRDWLRGNRTVDLGGGSWTDYYSVATVRTGAPDEVWLVGHVVDVGASRPGRVVRAAEPRPVLGVALMVGDRIRWVRRVAG
ncbi:hypothetical protein [Kineosporia sp. A_224]|uniref:hypothetical protein n=1 Tax=Kineosporia sp. A_224 TaxID=1962180 RepID=UPI000B4BEFD9|nr:hypothetical protein [Kineosporia sp. A_224]